MDVTSLLETKEILFFIRDISFARGNQVYSGHSGTGKKFSMFQSDYGKYAMNPLPKKRCEALIKEIEKAAKGKLKKDFCTFTWDIVPMTKIELCNFYEIEEHEAYDRLKAKQTEMFVPF